MKESAKITLVAIGIAILVGLMALDTMKFREESHRLQQRAEELLQEAKALKAQLEEANKQLGK